MKHTHFILLLIAFLYTPITLCSIITGTLIKTPHGLVPIENLQINDYITAYHAKKSEKSLCNVRITKITESTIDTIFAIETTKGIVIAAKNQLLYDPTIQQWVKAQNITTDTTLFSADFSSCHCTHITQHTSTTKIYNVSVDSPHNFFISNTEILTHNFFPIVIGLTFTFGEGLASIGFAGLMAALGSFGVSWLKKNNQTHTELFINDNFQSSTTKSSSSISLFPQDPDDENDTQNKREKILTVETYEQALNLALDILNIDDDATSQPFIGSIGIGKNKIVGRKWYGNKAAMRLDYDPLKGPHINVTDYRMGKGIKGKSVAILFKGTEVLVKTLIKNLNR